MYLFVFIIMLLSGCQSIFFQPDAYEYSDLKSIGYQHQRFFIESDGQPKLHAWYLQTAASQKRGVVVQFHGNGQNMTAHAMYLQWFLDHGFDALTFDYRGYGQSQGKPDRAGIIEDGKRVLDYAAQKFKGQRIILFGQSLGGAIAVSALHQRGKQSDFAMLLLDCPVASYRSVVRRKAASIWLLWPFQYPISWFFSNEYDPQPYYANIGIPTFMAHSEGDSIVDIEESQDILNVLDPKLTKEYATVPSDRHLATFADPQLDTPLRFLKFFEKNAQK